MRIIKIIQILISVSLIAFLINRISFQEIRLSAYCLFDNLFFFIAAILTPALGFYISSIRLKIISSSQNMDFSISELIKLNMIAAFYNQVLPSTVGGDLIRSVIISKSRNITGHTGVDKAIFGATLIGADRIFGILGLLITGLVAILINPVISRSALNIEFQYLIYGILFFLSTIFAAYSNWRFLKERLLSYKVSRVIYEKAVIVFEIVIRISRFKGKIILAILLSICIQLAVILEFCLIAKAIQLSVNVFDLAVIIPIVDFFSLIPASINGIGVRENVLYLFGANIGISATNAIILAYLYLAIKIFWGVLGGVTALRVQLCQRKKPEQL